MNTLKILTASLLISVAFSAHAAETKSYTEDKNGNSLYIKKIDPKGDYSTMYDATEQVGKNNRIFIEQKRNDSSKISSINIKQVGSKNDFTVKQYGNSQSISATATGDSNVVKLGQWGKKAGIKADITGNNNTANIYSGYWGASDANIQVAQTPEREGFTGSSYTKVAVNGDNNSVISGINNSNRSAATTLISGKNNVSEIRLNQAGKSDATIEINGDKNNFKISQDGSARGDFDNSLTAKINADYAKYDTSSRNTLNNNTGSISQSGTNNNAQIQLGNAFIYYDQIGVSEYNVSSIAQFGSFNSASISQSGHNNNASINQNSTSGLSATIAQDGHNNKAVIKQGLPSTAR